MAKSLKSAPALRTSDYFTIKITHLPTSEMVKFEGWVTEFQDNFSQTWNSETVYGRMDPLVTYQNTQRRISLGFDVVSDDRRMAFKNMAKINRLIEFLYPVYENGPGRSQQNVLEAAPLLRMQWTNLIRSANSTQGLIGHMSGLNYAPSMADGGFIHQTDQVTSMRQLDPGSLVLVDGGDVNNPEDYAMVAEYEDSKTISSQYVPKTVSLSFEFNVLHDHLGGWYKDEYSDKYVFGSDAIDGKFPNQNALAVATRTDKRYVTLDEDGEEDSVAIEKGPIALIKRAEILDGGNT